MIVVKTYLASDQYGGTGLFADEDIKKGDVVWRFDPAVTDIYPIADYQRIIAGDDEKAITLKKYAYPAWIEKGSDGEIERVMFHDLDNGSYINHEIDASVGYIDDEDTAHPDYDNRHNVNIAVRDIKRGEQITNNYIEFDPDFSITKIAENGMSFLLQMNGRDKIAS